MSEALVGDRRSFQVQLDQVRQLAQMSQGRIGDAGLTQMHRINFGERSHRRHVLVLDRRALEIEGNLLAIVILRQRPHAAAGFLDCRDRFGLRGRRGGRYRFGSGGHWLGLGGSSRFGLQGNTEDLHIEQNYNEPAALLE